MMKLYERANRLGALGHKCLWAIVSSEGLYLAVMMLFFGVLNTDVFMTRQHIIWPVKDYVVMPWAGVLMGCYLAREKKRGGLDIWALALLVAWIAVPFIMRFGTEHFTMYSTFGYALCFFVFYASVCERDAKGRARQLDAACAGYCLIALVLGGALLYCAWTGKVYYSYSDTQHFGVINGQLQHAMHYNLTGRVSLLCTMMCLVGLCRSAKKPYALFYLAGMVIMALVVVLTQSRTVRYAMLAAFALGTWNGLAAYLPVKKWWLRHAVAVACAAVVLVGGYKLSSMITDAALRHYAGQPSVMLEAVLPSAIAEEETTKAEPKAIKARDAGNATFSDRTNIWKNIFKNWKANPKHMLIGNGSGRTKWMVTENTIHESVGFAEVHNAYLHFAAEFGLIGFGLLLVFALCVVPPALRVFFATGEKRMPGGCALCLLLISILATGMMEIEPLDGMTNMCMVMFFALGQLAGAGRDMKE